MQFGNMPIGRRENGESLPPASVVWQGHAWLRVLSREAAAVTSQGHKTLESVDFPTPSPEGAAETSASPSGAEHTSNSSENKGFPNPVAQNPAQWTPAVGCGDC
jgi:hypothetical protein